MGPIGLPELAIFLVIVLVIFGPKRLPQLGRSLGGGMREFKNSITSKADEDAAEEAAEAAPLAVAAPPAQPAPSVDAFGVETPEVADVHDSASDAS